LSQLLKAAFCYALFVDVLEHLVNLKLEVVLGQEDDLGLLISSILLSNASNKQVSKVVLGERLDLFKGLSPYKRSYLQHLLWLISKHRSIKPYV
jgi:hypothetical protein